MIDTKFLILYFCTHACTAHVIYSLNDTEHDRMPPLITVDDYDRCLQRGGVYCMARVNLFADSHNKLFKQIQDYSAYTTKHYNYTFVDRGICLNTTCRKFLKDKNINSEKDIRIVLERCLNQSLWVDYGLQANLSRVFNCDQNTEELNINTLDWFVLGIFLTLVLINVIGSMYDLLVTEKSEEPNAHFGNKYLLSFSIIRNWKWMVTERKDDPQIEDLRVFDGVKTVVTLFVILAHVMFIISIGFSDNPHDFEKAYEYTHFHVIFNGMAIVQIFFMISGFFLVFYLEAAKTKELTWTSIPTIVFYRWCRLSPAYAVMLAFNATWLRHIGSGPAWGLFVSESVVADCRKYWWLHLLYVNNFQPDDKLCALQTWHVAAEMQLFLIGLVTYFATMRGGRSLALGVLLLVGMVAPALHVWLQDLDGVMLLTPETYRSLDNATFGLMHIRGYNNLAGYATGMAIYFIVQEMEKRNFNLRQYQTIRYANWFVFPALAVLFHTGRVFYVDGDRASLAFRMLYAATHRLVIALVAGFSVATVIMRCSDYLRDLFAWRGWLVPAKLSYAVYLLHMSIVHIVIGYRRQLVHVSFFYMMMNYLAIVMLVYLVAVPFYLLVEAPISRVIKIALYNTSTENNKKNVKVS